MRYVEQRQTGLGRVTDSTSATHEPVAKLEFLSAIQLEPVHPCIADDSAAATARRWVLRERGGHIHLE